MPTVGSTSIGRAGNSGVVSKGIIPNCSCVCPSCGFVPKAGSAEPCNERTCPKCGNLMIDNAAKLSEEDISIRLRLARARKYGKNAHSDNARSRHINIGGGLSMSLLGQSSDHLDIIKTKRTRHYQYYDVKTEIVKPSHKEARSVIMTSAYSKNGDYIGPSTRAYRLVHVYGIQVFEKGKPADNVCTIGYAPDQRKWYGWSHRGIHGFCIGSKLKKKRATTLSEAKRMAIAFADSIS